MKRKYKRRTSRFGIFFVFLTAVTIAGVFFIPWAMKPDNFRNEKNKINSWLNGIFFQDFYNAKSLILVDLSNDNIFISKRENEQQLPASLAKLFVIEYAATLADLDSIVPANYEAIQLTKPGSSVANIDAKKYFLHNLFAAMLVPSGNDAAYVVADAAHSFSRFTTYGSDQYAPTDRRLLYGWRSLGAYACGYRRVAWAFHEL